MVTALATLVGYPDVSTPANTNVRSLFVTPRAAATGGRVEFRLLTLYGGIVRLGGHSDERQHCWRDDRRNGRSDGPNLGQQVSDVAAALPAAINANGTKSPILFTLVATQTDGTVTAVASVPALVLTTPSFREANCGSSGDC